MIFLASCVALGRGAKFCGVRVYDFDGDVGENTKGSIFPKS